MGLADRVYKVSIFGEFESIQPDPETMLSFMQHFGAKGFVPSLYVEVLAGPNGAIQKNRVALVTNTGDRKITIGSSRIDIEFIQNEDAQFSIPDSCTSISDHAFKDCAALTQIHIPAACTLGTDVFDGCTLVYVFGTSGSPAETY